MNKKLVLALLSVCTLSNAMAFVPEGDYSSGNWSIVLDLNADKIQNVINGGLGANTGVNIVNWSGSAVYSTNVLGVEWVGGESGRTTSYWLGYGGKYFTDGSWVEASSGVSAGLQMGFAGGATESRKENAAIGNKPNLNTGSSGMENAGYYRADTKIDANNDFWQDANTDGTNMNGLQEIVSVTSATLAIVHSNNNGEGTNQYDKYWTFEDWSFKSYAHSQTMQYLTVTGLNANGKEITITYIAEVDDFGTTSPKEDFSSDYAPSSNRYDIDNLTDVQLNYDYVDGYYIKNEVLSPEQVGNFNPGLFISVPEPTSATLSMLALTALCARRRRRK